MEDKDQGLRITHALGPSSYSGGYVEYGDQNRLLGTPPSAFSSTPLFDDPGNVEARSPVVHFSQSSVRNGSRLYRRLEWYSIVTVYATGIYSTLMSGAWLTIAIKQPHWGSFITFNGSAITLSVAGTVVMTLAKSIELSFLTFFLAMMGQYLTRRASNNDAPGISLADVQLKVLMILPGTLFTQWKSYGRALFSFLGLVSLLACVSGMLYITASEALVNPKASRISSVQVLQAQLNTTPANYDYIKSDCPTTNANEEDSCYQVSAAGHAFNNFYQYMRSWQQLSTSGLPVDPTNRPPPIAVFKDNVTVQGSWVDASDVEAASRNYNRSITNVTMAMPNAGVVAAASLADNGLPQVAGTDGNMIANLDARVVVPTINALCAQGSAQELLPLVYQNWSNPLSNVSASNLTVPQGWHNSTVFDTIFGFSAASPPPAFYRFPGPSNSEMGRNYPRADSLYFLITSGSKLSPYYNLCGMSMGFRVGCSTELSVSMSGSILKSNCTQHDMSYNEPLQLAQNNTRMNWVNLTATWAEAVALDTGNGDSDAALPSMLVSQTVQSQSSNSTQPLMVEGLAVLAANTILDSMVAAPFDGSWPYPNNTLQEPVMQSFTASVTIGDFASGVGAQWQWSFIFVLGSVFVLNLVFLAYLILISAIRPYLSRIHKTDSSRNGLWKDCTDLSELFQIALNSPQPGLGSPVGVAQEKGELHDMKWHFRNGATVGTPGGGTDGLHLAFDGEQTYRMGAVKDSNYFYSPLAEGTSPGRRGHSSS